MTEEEFNIKLNRIMVEYNSLITKKNIAQLAENGIITRFKNPILTANHIPIEWRYDLFYEMNPYLLERLGINAVFNAGAIKLNDKYLLVARVEGSDRKSFFAVAESKNGIDNFKFWDYPVTLPQNGIEEVNVYDMRLTEHEDGWIYGVFCSERHDENKPEDTSAAIASAGIARTKDLITWERLPNLISYSGQQRNVVLHPEFINGKYAFYTRPQNGFIETGNSGGIGWGLCENILQPEIKNEIIIEPKIYHTVYEMKNGLGPPPIKTKAGWLHLAHGVRNTAAGLRYVLYMFLTDLADPSKIIYKPGGYFMAPEKDERIGDVSNVLFSNGWIKKENGEVLIYYSSSDKRTHVATSTVDILLDYVTNTPPDQFTSAECVEQRKLLIKNNIKLLKKNKII